MPDLEKPSLDTLPPVAHIRQVALDVIEQLRPGIQRDGGDLHLVDVVDDKVLVRLSGACTTCSLAGQTMGGVRRHLVQALGWPVRVIPAAL